MDAWFFLDERERHLVAAVLDAITRENADEAERLHDQLDRLARAADLVRATPSVVPAWSDRRGAARAAEPLIDLLCRVPDWDLDLHIPTKAVIGQAYLVAKINFFKALGYALVAHQGPADLIEGVRRELGQSVYSKLAEELFISIVTDPHGAREAKIEAARALFRIWDERLLVEIDDFAPLLESVWKAKSRVRPVFGTMRGTQELFSLLREGSDDRFVSYFTEREIPDEQLQAFEELLFGLAHEDIRELRAHIEGQRTSAISDEEAGKILGREVRADALSGEPQALYTSYKRRRVKAHYRAITGAPGPKRTAEEYVMIAFLLAEREG